jgi:hypothetical protein
MIVTFTNRAAQGDLMIRRVNQIPASAVRAEPADGVYICAHSETGHNHVLSASPRVQVYTTANPLLSYLQVIEATDKAEAVILRHLRSFNTHESISISPGMYEMRRQREYMPEGWRVAAD